MVLRAMLPPASQPFSSTATFIQAMRFGEVVSCREAMPAAAHDNHVIVGFERGTAPLPIPAGVTGEGIADQGKDRKPGHRAVYAKMTPVISATKLDLAPANNKN